MQIKIKEELHKKKATDPASAVKILTDVLKAESEFDKAKEHFWGIYLNSRNNIQRIELIFLGTLDICPIHPREVFRPAVKCSSAGLIVAHNHPSGDPEPTEADRRITKQLKEAGDILGIKLLDSLIITESGRYFSMQDDGQL